MDDSNLKTSQNTNTLNDGGAATSVVDDVRVEEHQTEGPHEVGTADAKRCKPAEGTEQQMTEKSVGSDQTEGPHESGAADAKRCKPEQGTEKQMTEKNVGPNLAGIVDRQSDPKTTPLLTQPPTGPPEVASTSKPAPGNRGTKKNKKRKRTCTSPNFSAGAIQSTNNQSQECASVKPVEDRSTFPSFRFMNVKIKLGLCAADHPRVFLTNFQLDTLAQLILNIILGPEGERVKPRFYGMSMMNGHLMLVCGDHTTAAWVRELPRQLLLGDIRLKAVEYVTDSKSFVAVGHFPKSEHESVQRILRFLEVQNQGLDCSRWRVMDRNPEKKSAVRMTFSVDWASAQLLKAKGPLLNFKFSKARFMLRTKRGVKFKEEECEGDDDDDDDLEFVESFQAAGDFNLYGQANPFAYGFPYDMPLGSQMQPYPGDFEGDYSARVAAAVQRAKTFLCEGLTSRERFQRKRNKKKKKGKAKGGPS